ncbi:GAF and ANTAR domain-containing protein [Amycolatopsis taiwanensis]|uniref:Transcriptional regulator n=1 Tax=Amycolatopsis taiwanensis TaxID=342230 RepID=A0A9W6VK80_9PSEU|nr:GAF and ANTAR domain-containing protein [Amycolatopsis taiwanensis]GLY69246.1 transcriptional regulator [Amycolatopsis taiwanensis]
MSQEQRLAAAFIELSDVHHPDFDADRYAHLLARHSVNLLDVDAAGWLLANDSGDLATAGGTTDSVHLLQIMQLRGGTGPAVESFHTHRLLTVTDLATEQRWETFGCAARDAGFRALHAMPLQQQNETIGALCLFRQRPQILTEDELAVGNALVQVASTCLLLKRARDKAVKLSAQLQTALNSRVAIEQAKGILAERRGTSLDHAFELMRTFARRNRRRLNEVAGAVVTGSPTVAVLSQTSGDKPQTCLSGWLS